jgi:hypothetical protein
LFHDSSKRIKKEKVNFNGTASRNSNVHLWIFARQMAKPVDKSDERSIKDRKKGANVRMQRTVVNGMEGKDDGEDMHRLWRILQNTNVLMPKNKLQLRLTFEKG